MKTLTAIFFVILCAGRLLAQQPPEEPRTIAAIESLYVSGQYLSAELEARRMREQSGWTDSIIVELERWIAFSLIAQGKIPSARDRFIAILRIDEGFMLDPILTSPKILSVFNDAKAKYSAARKAVVPDSTMLSNVTVRQSVTFRTMLFPGWEQLHHGRTTAGYLFLGAGAAALTSGLVCEFLRADARTQYLNARTPSDISSRYDTYNTYRKGEIYSFIAFGLIYFTSQTDVFNSVNISLVSPHHYSDGTQLRFSVLW